MPEKKKTKKFLMIIQPDSDKNNAAKEQFREYQKDGVTVRVAIGKQQEVPEWVAIRAKEIGDIVDYFVVE